jgi:hypothetical protein
VQLIAAHRVGPAARDPQHPGLLDQRLLERLLGVLHRLVVVAVQRDHERLVLGPVRAAEARLLNPAGSARHQVVDLLAHLRERPLARRLLLEEHLDLRERPVEADVLPGDPVLLLVRAAASSSTSRRNASASSCVTSPGIE